MPFSVAMTAHLSTDSSPSGILKFDDVKFSVGINNLTTYKNTGKFVCERKELYMISSTIMSEANGAHYVMYLNGIKLSDTYIGYSSSPPSTMYHTGTAVLARQLLPNDSVWVQKSSYSVHGGFYSTLTIVKVK